MNDKQKRVCKALVKPNCYLLFSASQRPLNETFGEYRAQPLVSFLYDNGNVATEWEPRNGPIQIWKKCNEYDDKAIKHYYYDFVFENNLNWSQLAVDEYELPQAAVNGDYDYIFGILEEWAQYHE